MVKRDLLLFGLGLFIGFIAGLVVYPYKAHAHVHDRPDLNSWFDKLASGKGLCCSFADGKEITDVSWDQHCESTRSIDGKDSQHCVYRVFLSNIFGKNPRWVDVPEDAVITEPNKYGPAMVWPYYMDDEPEVRCFLPGAGA